MLTMEVNLAVAADYANVTNEGKLNIMGVLSEVDAAAFPTTLQQIFLAITWEAGPAEFGAQKDVRIAFVDANANVTVKLDLPGFVVPHPSRGGSRVYFNQIVGMGGLLIDRAGEHAFLLLVGGEEKRRVPLYVNEPTTANTTSPLFARRDFESALDKVSRPAKTPDIAS
jgi:hypothetical protein